MGHIAKAFSDHSNNYFILPGLVAQGHQPEQFLCQHQRFPAAAVVAKIESQLAALLQPYWN